MHDFARQFYDKRLGWVVFGLLLTHIVAALVQGTDWSWLPLIAIGLGTAIVSYKKLEWGLALAFIELFIGGHGHLIDVTVGGFSLSMREVMFVAVMGAWVVQVAQKRIKPTFIAHRDWPFALIGLAIMIGAIHGFATNEPAAAFDDMNGYLTLVYFFPMISIIGSGDTRRLLLQTLAVSAVWIAVTTLVYLYAFTHLPGLASHELYTFVRDARLAEVTLQTTGPIIDLLGNSPWYFRVFQQSQIVVAFFELLLLAGTLHLWRARHEKLPRLIVALHVLMIATIIASLSRSFWIGCVVGFVTILTSLIMTRPVVITLVKRHLQLGLCATVAALTLFILVVVPLPARPDLSESTFYRGQDDNTREVAVSSRWNLLRPMIDEIWNDPVFGSGFGETVTFISDDPRLRAVTPSGEVTTYRFEWGYHDLWLKMGLLGLLAFGWIFITAMSVTIEAVMRRDDKYWLIVGLSAGLVMLYVTHVFSPYLNHPIGLGLILFSLPFFPWAKSELVDTQAISAGTRQSISIIKPNVGIAYKQ